MRSLDTFSEHLSRVIPAVATPDFPGLLVALLQSVVPADDATILLYPGRKLPTLEFFQQPEGAGASTLDQFLKGAFLLDPFYLAATRDRRFGVFSRRELAPTGFHSSEYYRTWYRNCGFEDECGYLIPIGEDGFVNIALAKTGPRGRFSRRELEIYRSILPVVDTLCRQHWESSATGSDGSALRTELQAALDGFGAGALTEREAQVINMVLHGHSTKTLADALSISTETVKLHRKHAYAKLEVGSQAELFNLFLNSIIGDADTSPGNPGT
jgi:DNA-binding CsgD family transcriptional regulator